MLILFQISKSPNLQISFSSGALGILPCCPVRAQGWRWIRESSISEHSHPLQASLPDPARPHPVPWSAPLPLPEDFRQPTHLLLKVVKSTCQNWCRSPYSLHCLQQEPIQSPMALLTQFHSPSRLPRFLNKKKAMFANSLTCF